MGKYNSSIYRVRPLMECIEKDCNAFLTVLSLVGIDALDVPQIFRYDGEICCEMQLKPPKHHLASLIDRMASKIHEKVNITGVNRLDLFFGEQEKRENARIKAMMELERHYDTLTSSDRPWYMFEGFTNPDIFIEGDDYVIVCEGKWTEPHITTTTTYLSSVGEYRSQMVRHIQGALNYTNKKVFAFYIVDAKCGYIEDLTKESFSRQLAFETIQLSETEKVQILESFYGYTTWQAIQEKLPYINFQSKSSIT